MSESAHDRIAAEAREMLSAGGLAPDDPATVEQVVRTLVDAYQERSHRGLEDYPLRDTDRTVREIAAEIGGYGALEALLLEPGVEDIIIEGADVRAIRGGRVVPMTSPTTEDANRHTVDRLLAGTMHALSASTPVVDGVQVELGGGRQGRLAAAIPPVTEHLSADIRVFGGRHGDLAEMVADGTLSAAAANLLTLVLWSKGSVLIGGATGTRKSTLLVSLLRRARPWHCVRLVEESMELSLRIQHGGRYQCSPGEGSRTLSDLVRFMLRMRADLIVVGEVRGAECWDLAQAASSGAGWMATIHSRSAEGSLDRLILLSLLAGQNISRDLVRNTFADSLDVVVHCERSDNAEDYLAGVTEVRAIDPSLVDDRFSSTPLFTRASLADPLEWSKAMPEGRLAERLGLLLPEGWDLHDLLTSKELIA